ncbi:MAG: hypothetical protein OEM52_10970 [bacterium]|nr:hypothetical protein [bacterium]
MSEKLTADQYLRLSQQLLAAAQAGDEATVSVILTRREQSAPILPPDLKKKVLELDRQTMVLLSTESTQLKQKLDRIEKGIRTLGKYTSGHDSRGIRFDASAE